MLFHVLVVGHTVFDHRTGDEVFELVLVPFVEGFELVINVYDEVLPDISQRVLLLRIYLTRVAVTVQGWRTELIQKRGFELSLLARQHETGVVTTLTVVHGIGDHCHEPFGEVRQPLVRVTHHNATCQVRNGFQ